MTEKSKSRFDAFREEVGLVQEVSRLMEKDTTAAFTAVEMLPLGQEAKVPLYAILAVKIGGQIDRVLADARIRDQGKREYRSVQALEIMYKYCIANGLDGTPAKYSGRAKGTRAVFRKP